MTSTPAPKVVRSPTLVARRSEAFHDGATGARPDWKGPSEEEWAREKDIMQSDD